MNGKILTPVIHTLEYTTYPLSTHNHSFFHNLSPSVKSGGGFLKLNLVNVFLSYTHVGASLYLHSLSYSLCLFASLGGGYLSGAGAQEENLFRRTNYVQHLADPEKKFDPSREWKYRIPEFSCIYSKNVFIIRASEAEGYKFLANPVPMSFLALPAYPNPTLTKDKKKLIPLIAENTKRKIRCLLSAGLYYGHDSLVLSALGCGAFRNPASHMAQLFKDVLSEGRFANRYKHISFAILDDHNARGDGNFKPFLEVFADCT